jgi:hypothetical protein
LLPLIHELQNILVSDGNQSNTVFLLNKNLSKYVCVQQRASWLPLALGMSTPLKKTQIKKLSHGPLDYTTMICNNKMAMNN